MGAISTLDVKFTDVSTSADSRTFTGYASTFGNVDLTGDIVSPGAFAGTLAAARAENRMPRMFYMHDPAQVPGRWLDLREDSRGLFAKGEFANTTLGNECRELLRTGAIDALSIGYRATKTGFDRDGNRLLLAVDLAEISIVSLPANPEARVLSAKAQEMARAVTKISDFEKLLHGGFGFSRGSARRLAAKTWPHFHEALHGSPAGTAANQITSDVTQVAALAVLRAAAAKIRGVEL